MSNFRTRILEPLLIPLAAFAFVGGVAWGLSRFLLATTANGATFLALAAAVLVLAACAAIATTGFHATQRGVTIASYVAIVAGGSVFAATAGIRPVHTHLPEPSFEITASNATSFDTDHIHLEEEEEQVVRFTNKDPAAPHNWGVLKTREYSADPAQVVVDAGTSLGNGESRDYLLEADEVPPGTYFYFCFIHPNMTGQLDIGAGGQAPPTSTARPTGAPPPPPTGPPGATRASISAENVQFNTDELRLAAGRQVEIVFENRESLPHNIAIARDEAFSDRIFEGEQATSETITYRFTGPPPGTYFFRCDFHPAMKGTAVFA